MRGLPVTARSEHLWLLLLLAAAIMAAFLAVRQMSHSLWFDETQTANIAQAPTLAGLVEKAIHERPYPPLYFLVDRVSWKLRRDEIGMRFPSAIFGALATIAVYLFGASLLQARTAAAAALLFCLMPGMFAYFIDANPYTLLALTSTLSAWGLWRALGSDRAEDWMLYVAAAAGGLACHALFVFHIGSHLLAGLVWKRSLRWSVQPRFYKALTLVFLLWISWAIFFRLNRGLQRPIVLGRLLDGNLTYVFAATFVGFVSLSTALAFLTWPILQVAGSVTLFLRDKRLFAFLASLIAPPLIGISLFTHAALPFTAYRYGSGIFPLTCLVGASVLETSFGRLAKVTLAVLVIVNLVAGASVVVGAPIGFFDHEDWSGVAAFLAQNGAPGDTLLLDPGWNREALNYYYHGPLAREYIDDSGALGPNVLEYCRAHSDGRKWLIIAGSLPSHTAAQWKAVQMAQRGLSLSTRLQESGRVTLGPPRLFTGITVYALSCHR
jgi:4-amino-4-deoxy-L-arabinose transferase-like glycosyltransferase